MEKHNNRNHVEHQSVSTTYTPLWIVLGGILVGVIAIQFFRNETGFTNAMRLFMGLFFVTFGFFKTLDWRGFTSAYAEYDIVAKRSSIYAYVYPLIELSLGVAYLSNSYLIAVNIITVVIMGIGSIGVIKTLVDKKKIRCACLGTVIKLPMTTITVIEDLGMGLMALAMLLL